jgi:hypothetical protein
MTLANLALALLSLAITWLALELVVFPRLLPWLPLRIHAGLPRALRPLAQSSKSAVVPEHYVALLGDSYAQGAGDWLLEVDARRNPAYYSAHLLHDQTGIDVISFGASGAGSLRAMGTEPETFVDYLRHTWRFRLPDPDLLLIYFYEGNDLQDNLRDLDHTYFGGGFDPARIYDGDYFRHFVRETAALRTPLAENVATRHWSDNFFLARFGLRIIRALVERSWGDVAPARDWSPGRVNRAQIGGREVALPDGLQGPPLELAPDRLELALWAHAQAFALLREHFHGVPTLVVYLPSPLAIYSLDSAEVDLEVTGPDLTSEFVRFPADDVSERSAFVCRRIEEITRAGGGEFLDAEPKLRRAALEQPIHGPRDWKHYNRRGQEALADAIAPVVEALLRRSSSRAPGVAGDGACERKS